VSHDSIEELRNGITTELPSNKACYGYFPGGKEELDGIVCTHMLGMAFGVFDIPGVSLNELFPHVQETQLEAFLQECWKKSFRVK
jgi:hypothetical protein